MVFSQHPRIIVNWTRNRDPEEVVVALKVRWWSNSWHADGGEMVGQGLPPRKAPDVSLFLKHVQSEPRPGHSRKVDRREELELKDVAD